MASKFQNRLIGTVVIVALGVIVLPGLLDGQKKHYQDEFAAIPLVPQPGEEDEGDVIPPVTQALSEAPQPAPQTSPESQTPAVAAVPRDVAPPQDVTVSRPPQQQADAQPARSQQQVPPAKPKPAPKPVEPPRTAEVKPKPESKPKSELTKSAPPQPTPKPSAQEKAPVGQAYVVQLGALRNAAKANEIVARLRLSGYRAYTAPATPVQGEITRVFVGPDASKQKLEASLSELNRISGLSGQVRSYGAK